MDDGYDGPAALVHDGGEVAVTVSLRGYFEPITGRYTWYGRVASSPAVTDLADGSTVLLRTPFGSVSTALRDVDPWGRPRVAGIGTPPFEVLDVPLG